MCFNIHRSDLLTALTWLVPLETDAVLAQVLCTSYNHALCHFMQSHIRKVYACLDVTSHLYFCLNDRGLLRATAVSRGWNGYRNKSAQKADTGEENSPATPAGIGNRDLSIISSVLKTTELSPFPERREREGP